MPLPNSYAVNVAENVCKHTGFHTPSHYSATSDTHPPVGGGVLDAPWVAIQYGVIWTGKPSSLDVGEGVLTLPLAVRREILVTDGWFVQPTFSQTATQGRAGTPAPTTRVGRVRNNAAERIVTYDMMRGGQYNTYVFRCPTEGSSRTPTPTVGR